MPNVRAFRAGNWSDTNPATSPWGTGGVLYAPASNDDVWLNNFNVTVDVSTTVISITNGSATSRFWKDGATTTATAGGTLALNNGVTLTANLISANSNICSMSSGSAAIVGNITTNGAGTVNLASTATLTVTGNITGGSSGNGVYLPAGSASIYVTGNVTGGDGANCRGIMNQGTGLVSVVGAVTAGGGTPAAHGILADAAGTVIVVGNCTASVSSHAISSTNANGVVRASGSFISATNGRVPVFAAIFTLNTTPSVAVTRYALSGLGTFVNMFTADNNLGQAAPTDVRSGVTYASGNLTGRLTIPARGTVANGVTVGPNMPFTATRSGTTATATLTYSYPYQVGDVITVTGASNSEWNMDYTITEVVSGTSVRWTVPATHSATAGTGANAQTKGTAVLDGSSVTAAVWGAATSSLTTAGSIGERLKNCSTVDSTGTALATALTAP